MHRLIVFDETAALSTDGWRLAAREVADLSSSAELLNRCRQRLTEVDELRRVRLEEAAAEGFAAGFADGKAAARREAAEQMSGFLAELAVEQARSRAAVGRLAVDVVKILLGEIDAGRAIELFVSRRLDDLLPEQPLAVRVPTGCGPAVECCLSDRRVGVRVEEDFHPRC